MANGTKQAIEVAPGIDVQKNFLTAAFNQLYPQLPQLIRHILNQKRWFLKDEEVEDCAQEISLKWLSMINRYNEEEIHSLKGAKSILKKHLPHAIIDYIRSNITQRGIQQFQNAVQNILNGNPQASEGEVAAALGLPLEQYRDKLLHAMTARPPLPIDDPEHPVTLQSIEPSAEAQLCEDSEPKALRAILSEWAASASKIYKKWAQVVTLYDIEGKSLQEIGATLNVSESRVCQIHGEALAALKTLLKRKSEAPLNTPSAK